MTVQKITFLLAGLLLCWGSVLAKYELIVNNPSASGVCDGSIIAKTDGNSGPYTFDWFDSSDNPILLSTTSPGSSQSTISNLCNLNYKVIVTNGYGCATTLYPNLVNLEITVFLEGACEETCDEMTTVLNVDRGLLPGQNPTSGLAIPTPAGQPYQAAPWNYTGIEGENWTSAYYSNEIVDWVLVSVRSGTAKSTELETKAGLLKKTGEVIFMEPFNNLSDFTQAYIVVEHRNHLPIMTPTAVSLSDNKMVYDFTAGNSYTTGTGSGQINKNGKWLMISGNGKQSGGTERYDLNGNDKITWDTQNGKFDQYFDGDFNLDGDVNGQDKIFWGNHNGKFTDVPQ